MGLHPKPGEMFDYCRGYPANEWKHSGWAATDTPVGVTAISRWLSAPMPPVRSIPDNASRRDSRTCFFFSPSCQHGGRGQVVKGCSFCLQSLLGFSPEIKVWTNTVPRNRAE